MFFLVLATAPFFCNLGDIIKYISKAIRPIEINPLKGIAFIKYITIAKIMKNIYIGILIILSLLGLNSVAVL